jgi:hypothetical protein
VSQRVALDAFGDIAKRDKINPFVRLLWERGTLFERDTIAKLQLSFIDLSRARESGTGGKNRARRLATLELLSDSVWGSRAISQQLEQWPEPASRNYTQLH